ncbi:TIGR02587 family membrane protein [Blastococcus xanthinilyticus]|uniref:Putative integral membrane protein (TIGR02587 family) n=1 Tax=Blastococcus xanthinilyticus TaxID=1564164 RepID=A0A5S5CXW4_9ACTN|nr:TIGR02587 family membrane protein [Blastococcus xanthinilyticus]TYP88573.1 putative integral membrane protein (TIGR02587 family) [Blastococcus xanthinilyticus]
MTGTGSVELTKGFGRAIAGSLLFALPLLMTMELWRLAHSVERYRLALLVLAAVLLVIGLSRTFGAGPGGVGPGGYLADAGVAILAATLAATVVLAALGVVDPLMDWQAAVSVVAIEALPAAVGASYARSQLGQGSRRPRISGYGHELFLMTAGAVVFAANIAPTEEVVLLAAEASTVTVAALAVLSLLLMHGFVYGVGFGGQERSTEGFLRSFLTLTVVGYAAALAISAYLLWTFGRFDGIGLTTAVKETVVLGLPGSIGAAAARLIL